MSDQSLNLVICVVIPVVLLFVFSIFVFINKVTYSRSVINAIRSGRFDDFASRHVRIKFLTIFAIGFISIAGVLLVSGLIFSNNLPVYYFYICVPFLLAGLAAGVALDKQIRDKTK